MFQVDEPSVFNYLNSISDEWKINVQSVHNILKYKFNDSHCVCTISSSFVG